MNDTFCNDCLSNVTYFFILAGSLLFVSGSMAKEKVSDEALEHYIVEQQEETNRKLEIQFEELPEEQKKEIQEVYENRHEYPEIWTQYQRDYGLNEYGEFEGARLDKEQLKKLVQEEKDYNELNEKLKNNFTQEQIAHYYRIKELAESGNEQAKELLLDIHAKLKIPLTED